MIRFRCVSPLFSAMTLSLTHTMSLKILNQEKVLSIYNSTMALINQSGVAESKTRLGFINEQFISH